MTTRPIELADWELEGIKAGRISMLWRPVEPQPSGLPDCIDHMRYVMEPFPPHMGRRPRLELHCFTADENDVGTLRDTVCPFGVQGGVLYAQEAFEIIAGEYVPGVRYLDDLETWYPEYHELDCIPDGWRDGDHRPASDMTAALSRFKFRIAGVCAKRLHDITYAEVIDACPGGHCDICGYTLQDAHTHMDHHLCEIKGGMNMHAIAVLRAQWIADYGDKYPTGSNPWAWGLRIEV